MSCVFLLYVSPSAAYLCAVVAHLYLKHKDCHPSCSRVFNRKGKSVNDVKERSGYRSPGSGLEALTPNTYSHIQAYRMCEFQSNLTIVENKEG